LLENIKHCCIVYTRLKELEKQITGQKTFSSFACPLMKTGRYLKVLNSPGPANSFDSERFKKTKPTIL